MASGSPPSAEARSSGGAKQKNKRVSLGPDIMGRLRPRLVNATAMTLTSSVLKADQVTQAWLGATRSGSTRGGLRVAFLDSDYKNPLGLHQRLHFILLSRMTNPPQRQCLGALGRRGAGWELVLWLGMVILKAA